MSRETFASFGMHGGGGGTDAGTDAGRARDKMGSEHHRVACNSITRVDKCVEGHFKGDPVVTSA